MKVLIIGNFGHGWDGSICDEEHIAKALEDLGHTVVRYQRELTQEFNESSYKHPASLKGEVDFTLIAQWNGYPENLVETLPKPVVYWAFDYQYNKTGDAQAWEEWHYRLARESDLFLSKEMEHLDAYRAIGANFRWLPQDFAPDFLDKHTGPKEEPLDVVFTGSHLPWSPERTKLLKAVDNEFNLHIFSVTPEQWRAEGFKNVNGPVMDHGLPELYSRAKINLSIDWKYSAGYWSDRNAQIMACGGFVLFRHVPMSEVVFRDNIGYFYNETDMLDRIDYWLRNPSERILKAHEGYAYAQSNLKVKNRVQDLLTIVEEYL